jgi:hypothetical protein
VPDERLRVRALSRRLFHQSPPSLFPDLDLEVSGAARLRAREVKNTSFEAVRVSLAEVIEDGRANHTDRGDPLRNSVPVEGLTLERAQA